MSLVDHLSASPCGCDRRARQETNSGAAVTITGALPIPFSAALDRVEGNPFLKVHLRAVRPRFLERLARVLFLL
jgi:hypothetical protein